LSGSNPTNGFVTIDAIVFRARLATRFAQAARSTQQPSSSDAICVAQ